MANSGFYQKYNISTTDPSQGLLAATKATQASVKDVIAGIGALQRDAEGQIIQGNTQQATDMFKQQIAQQGLGILSKPIDQEVALRPFGNMVDKTTIAKTLAEQTDIMKNSYINQYSAEADDVLVKTGDPIQAREHLKQSLLKANAPSTFADQEAVNYDLRKAAEIKNIGIRDAQAEDTAIATVMEAGKTGGYQNMKTVAAKSADTIAPYKRAGFIKKIASAIEGESTPTPYDSNNVNSAIAAYKEETANTLKAKLENRQQQNDQKLNVSNSTSSSSGSESVGRSGNKSKTSNGLGPDLIDAKGVVNPSVAVTLGNHVNNFVEKLSSSSDSAVIKALHKDIFNAVGSEEVAGNILGQVYSYAYKGDSWTGNDLSKKDLEDMKKKAGELVLAYNEKPTGNSASSSSSRSTARSGNISFTNADDITKYISDRKRGELDFVSKLNEAARNNKLGVTNYDGVQRLIDAYTSNKNNVTAPTPVTTQIMNIKNALPSAVPTTTSTANKGATDQPGAAGKIGVKPPAPVKDEAQRLLERAKAIEATDKNKPKVAPPVVSTVPVTETGKQRYERQNREQEELNYKLSNKLKAKPTGKTDPHAGQIEVISPKYGKVWVAADTDLAKFKFRLYNK